MLPFEPARRTILFISASRADYGRQSPIWRAVAGHPGLKMVLCATGTHLLEAFGYTRAFFDRDGFSVDYEIRALPAEQGTGEPAVMVGHLLLALDPIMERVRPDMVFVFGDRSEMLAPAIAALHRNIALVHMGGGFTSFGAVDESIRHALTKMAHIHLATSKRCAERIGRLGEALERIHFVGSPAVDVLKSMAYLPRDTLFARLKLDPGRPLVIATFHPASTEAADAGDQAEIFFDALQDVGAQTIVTYPNADRGGRAVIAKLKRSVGFRVVQDLSMALYLNVLRHADVMAGNSSSGFIEAPYFHLPVVNVGSRQLGRDREVNIVDVPVDRNAIAAAVAALIGDTVFRRRIRDQFDETYGSGEAAAATARILSTVALDRGLLQKPLVWQEPGLT